MQELLVTALRSRRPAIRSHWEALLRAEPVTTPLGNPDALIHLIEWTLDEIFVALGNPLARSRVGGTRFSHDERAYCPCGRNPLLTYFAAGEQAVREALILAQASSGPLDPLQRDASLYELDLVFQQISRREIEAFCGICQFRRPATSCEAAQPAGAHASEHA